MTKEKMYQKRHQTTTKLPIKRKGTKYVVRASSHIKNSVPLVMAIRDMLKLARTSGEVKQMIKNKQLMINGKLAKDYKESIKLFNILHADKHYILTLSPTHKFTLIPSKSPSTRLCKVTNKKILKSGNLQLNLHDGSNILTKDKINVGDSIYLDFSGKIKSHIAMEKGKKAFIISGKYSGLQGKVESLDRKTVLIKLPNSESLTKLNKYQIIIH